MLHSLPLQHSLKSDHVCQLQALESEPNLQNQNMDKDNIVQGWGEGRLLIIGIHCTRVGRSFLSSKVPHTADSEHTLHTGTPFKDS